MRLAVSDIFLDILHCSEHFIRNFSSKFTEPRTHWKITKEGHLAITALKLQTSLLVSCPSASWQEALS